MKKPSGTKKKRNQNKYPAFVPGVNSRVRQEFIDYDYLDKLNEDELAWLNKFTEEYTNASLILDDDNQIDPEKNIHKTAEHKKDIYDRNNARNRCLYGQIKSKVATTKLLNYESVINMVEEELSNNVNPQRIEDSYVDFIEYTEIGISVEDAVNEYYQFMKTFIGYE